MKNWIFIFLAILQFSCKEKQEINITFTGDVNLDRGVKEQLRIYGDSLIKNSFKSIPKNNYIVINFEGTFTSTNNKQDDKYNFKVGKDKVSALKRAGVTHVSIANNHVYDYGIKGFEDTVEAIKSQKLTALGNECEPRIITQGSNTCAILSVSLTAHNKNLCNATVEKVKQSIIKYKIKDVPLILFIHWGLEIQSKPEKWQRDLAMELMNLGVDAIIGHHPHVTQTIEYINNKPIFYSLGNFIADAYLPKTKNTYTVTFGITDKINTVKIEPYILKKFFPEVVNQREQIQKIKDYLFFSEDICAYKSEKEWIIKPIDEINFKEETSLWIFAAHKKSIVIKKMKSGKHLMRVYAQESISNPIHIFGKLSEIEIADINNDTNIDVLLGVTKKVHFDTIAKKRINIYSIKNNKLKTLWLGTKFINDVVHFDVNYINNNNYLSTIEINRAAEKIKRVYKWDNFGFALTEINQVENENKK